MLSARFSILTLAAAAIPTLAVQAQAPATTPSLAVAQSPGVDVWLDTDFYESLVKAQAFFNAVPGSYVTVIRVSTRNTLEVLYPANPASQIPYARNDQARTTLEFRTDAGTGLGVIYAIASDKPFDYTKVSDGGRWSSDRLSHPKGNSVQEVAGYFFNEIVADAERRFAMAQAAFINGSAVYKVGDPGFPTVSAVIDAAGLACNWSGKDTEGRVCGEPPQRKNMKDPKEPTGVITGTVATPLPRSSKSERRKSNEKIQSHFRHHSALRGAGAPDRAIGANRHLRYSAQAATGPRCVV